MSQDSITHAKFTFENGDILDLEEHTANYIGIGEVRIITLMYGEKVEDYFEPRKTAYMAFQTEYFHPSELKLAIKAFERRKQNVIENKDCRSTGMGKSIEEISKM